jgi:hypothetical protein
MERGSAGDERGANSNKRAFAASGSEAFFKTGLAFDLVL